MQTNILCSFSIEPSLHTKIQWKPYSMLLWAILHNKLLQWCQNHQIMSNMYEEIEYMEASIEKQRTHT